MAEMPRYRCHKEVWALKILSITPIREGECAGPTAYCIIPDEEGYHSFDVPAEWFLKHRPEPGGYYVAYKDGYKSYSPAQAFEEGYTRA